MLAVNFNNVEEYFVSGNAVVSLNVIHNLAMVQYDWPIITSDLMIGSKIFKIVY